MLLITLLPAGTPGYILWTRIKQNIFFFLFCFFLFYFSFFRNPGARISICCNMCSASVTGAEWPEDVPGCGNVDPGAAAGGRKAPGVMRPILPMAGTERWGKSGHCGWIHVLLTLRAGYVKKVWDVNQRSYVLLALMVRKMCNVNQFLTHFFYARISTMS